MLAKRIIPTLLARGDKLVKGERFDSWRTVGVVEQAFRIHQARAVDEICLLDVAATPEGRGPDFDSIERLTASCFSPVTVGGGVRSVEDVRRLLTIGADKVSICTGGPRLVNEIANRFGSQAVVAVTDVKDGYAMVRCGTTVTRQPAVGWAVCCETHGAGEILLTSVDRDGTMQGYDLDLIRAVSEAVSIPVIASGGCGTPQHALEAIQAGASAVAIGAMFLFSDETPKSVAAYLNQHGVEVRL